MEDSIAFVEDILRYIDGVIQIELDARAQDEKYLRLGSWKEDDAIKTFITDLRSQSQIISHSCVKFSLLISPKIDFHSNAMVSILEEIRQQSQTVRNIFHHLLSSSLGTALFDEITAKIKGLFLQILEMLKFASNRDKDNLNYTTGMVTKIAEEMQKIPLANKAAYRRFFMQKIVAIKETKEEFDKYLQQARDIIDSPEQNSENKGKKGTKEETEEDEEDDDNDYLDDMDDEDEAIFTVEEIPVVEKCLNIFNETINCLKFTLKYFTEVADHMQRSVKPGSEEEKQLQQWIAMIEKEGQVIENLVVDVGAELYPPLDTTNPQYVVHAQNLAQKVLGLVSLLLKASGTVLKADNLEEIEKYQLIFQSYLSFH